MKKVVKLEIIIFVVTLAIVFVLAFSGQSSYSGYQKIDWNNALTFDLQTGQTVTGSFSLFSTETTDYIIYNQDIGEVVVSRTSEHEGDFTFTAKTDGEYILRIHANYPFVEYMNYSYSISVPPILGVDRTVLTGIVIAVGVVLALTIAVWDSRRARIKKEDKAIN